MADEYSDTDKFRGAKFTSLDFSGVTIRDCDVRKLKIVRDLVVLEARNQDEGITK